MKNLKKILCLVLVAASMSVFAACEDKSEPVKEEFEEETTIKVDGEEVTVGAESGSKAVERPLPKN